MWKRLLPALMAVLLLLLAQATEAAPAPAGDASVVTVCGESAVGDDEAVEDAKQRAVRKVLGRLMAISDDPASAFQRISRDYRKYVVGKVKVVNDYRKKGTHYAVCKVSVDFGGLQRAIKTVVSREKNEELDDTVYFLIRVNGCGDTVSADNAQNEIVRTYNAMFRYLGFTPGNQDEEALLLSRDAGSSYADFMASMRGQLAERVDVVMAVIGEINLTPLVNNAEGCTVRSNLQMEVWDLGDNRLITSMTDSYELRRATAAEAYKFILDKSAINSAKVLAQRTLDYWIAKPSQR